jgi:hypothetical protein
VGLPGSEPMFGNTGACRGIEANAETNYGWLFEMKQQMAGLRGHYAHLPGLVLSDAINRRDVQYVEQAAINVHLAIAIIIIGIC